MATGNPRAHGSLTVGTVITRRKPTLTYQSPPQSTAIRYSENALSTLQSTILTGPPLPPPTRLPREPDISKRSIAAHTPSRHHTAPLLPLYHPFGALALSLPDLDPTAFGLPAPVVLFDDSAHRARQRRPTVKLRDADDPIPFYPSSLVHPTPAPESDFRDKPTSRRRRGGGPGGKRRRRDVEDGDATYPAKRPRHPRSSGIASGLSGTRALSREAGSPSLSNTRSRASPAPDAGRVDVSEGKEGGRRTTRSRGAIARRDSTTSDETTMSTTPSVSAGNPVAPRVTSGGELLEADEPGVGDTLNEATDPAVGDDIL